ncbi:MAG: chromosome segregation protein SMC [Clostridia bacterium]|nr:chromosome segregation protein SMC [Clostridia bacterium]
MRLKQLEIQGFKSFPDRLNMGFGKGITAIVGPNGSGKSNVSDAIRWVLGEQSSKSLRGVKMEDVIFNGTRRPNGTPMRKPQGFAEVTLVLDNSDRVLAYDDDEVNVTRRYYRSGESEYLINKKLVRLKDVYELFMDTGLGRDGYSLIGQGRIAEIVAAKSDDRREIFEEAAGISKYRYRKEDAERKLARTEDNLVRLRDIISEIESRIGPLKEQAEKAKQYNAFRDEKKELEIGLWLVWMDKAKKNTADYDGKIAVVRERYDNIIKSDEDFDKQIDEAFDDMNRITAEMDTLRREASGFDEKASELREQAALLTYDAEKSAEASEKLKNDIAAAEEKANELFAAVDEQEGKLKEIYAGRDEVSAQIEALLAELDSVVSDDEKAGAEINALESKLSAKEIELTDLRIELSGCERLLDESKPREEQLAQREAEAKEKLAEAEKRCEAASEVKEACDKKLRANINSCMGFDKLLEAKRTKLSRLEEEQNQALVRCDTLKHRADTLRDMEKHMEGFAGSVKSISDRAKAGVVKGVIGTVAELIKVEPKYAVAAETALGAGLQNVVVKDEECAKRAIDVLRREGLGRATFLPLTSVKGKKLSEAGVDKCNGFIGYGTDIVTHDKEYAGVISHLLGTTVVASDLDKGTEIAKKYSYRFRIVTLDGQVINAGGSFTGGSQSKSSGILSRRNEIDKLEKELLTAKKTADELSASAEEQRNALASSQAEYDALRAEQTALREDILKAEGELSLHEAALEAAQQVIENIASERENGEANIAKLKAQSEAAKKSITAAESECETLRADLAGLTEGRSGIDGRRRELTDKVNELKLKVSEAEITAAAQQTRINDTKARIAELHNQKDNYERELREIAEKTAQSEGKAQDVSGEIAELRRKAEDNRRRADAMLSERESREQSIGVLRHRKDSVSSERDSVIRELTTLESKRANIDVEYKNILDKLYEEYGMTRNEAEAVGKRPEELGKAQRRLNEIKNGIKALGDVNVGAIEEYAEVSERYEFLDEQVGDCEESKKQLLGIISECTESMRDMFNEQFAVINKNFGEVFTEMFGGGNASLELSNADSPLDSGIEIKAQPPGKVVKNLSALSGGEQALVAICIYFAILRAHPSPFCVLDEIDTALDEANVGKFADFVTQMNGIQFVVITHRRGTMESADVLYGVTMEEPGVSKVVSLDMRELEKQLKEKK